jgi:hypothetical protein
MGMNWVKNDMEGASDDELFDAIARKDRELDGAPDDEFTRNTRAIRDAMVEVYTGRR